MNRYPHNSPEAVSQVLAMIMVTDGKLHPREIEVLDHLRIYEIIGISRLGFMKVVHDYCGDLLARPASNGRIKLVDKARIDDVIGLVNDRQLRVLTCGMLLNVINADDHLSDPEVAVLRYILERWEFSLESLEGELLNKGSSERAVA